MLRRSSSFLLGSACAVLVAFALGVLDPPATPVTVGPAAAPRSGPEVTARTSEVTAEPAPQVAPPKAPRLRRGTRPSPPPPRTDPPPPPPIRETKPITFVARARALDPLDTAARRTLMDAMIRAAQKLPPAQKNRVTACVGLAGSIPTGADAKRRLTKCAGLLSSARP